MSEIASLAKKYDIKVMFSQTPLLFETSKNLVMI